MSTNYRTADRDLRWDDFWSDLPAGLTENVGPKTRPDNRCLTDGEAYLWCFSVEGIIEFCRYGGNDVQDMLDAVAEHFDVDILSEHDEGFFDGEDDGIDISDLVDGLDEG